MNRSIILTILRREVRDATSDWRVVAPILLLTFIFPQMLVFASNVVVNFVADPDLPGRLVPFAVLLVGFIPASFSLINALESFVGERERNTLESLLAMPISDTNLYIGKLCSSLITPLTSSLAAMAFFCIQLLFFNPEIYFAAMTLSRFLLVLLLILSLAIVMVTAAVVISANITTVRAANLMSSFILLPAAFVIQIAAVQIINSQWQTMWFIALALMVLAAFLVRAGLVTFNREAILSREHRQGNINFLVKLFSQPSSQRLRPQIRNARPERVLVQRELREVLSDWRVLLPLAILSIGLPLAMAAGINFAIDFVDDETLLGRLVPFASLLVSFVPASFALITAIESFVGERERNSLESLLALPLSDRALYVGKFIAALIIPLLGSLLAQVLFLAAVRYGYPSLYADSMTTGRFFLVLLMTVVINVLLVSGAVVISSHTSSIRAATLLASGVLVPTAVSIQLQALLFISNRYDVIRWALAALFVIALALLRSGLASFNREEILSREHDDLNLRAVLRQFQRFYNEYRPAGFDPNAYQGLPFSPARFYRSELPALLRELRLPLLFGGIAAASGLLLGGYIGQNFRVNVLYNLLEQLGNVPPASPLLALEVFANNLRVSILSNLFSVVSFGIFPFLVPAVAFAQVGFVATMLTEQGGSWVALGPQSPLQFILGYVAPHGIVELPTFILSTALGLRMGAALLAQPPGFSAGQNMLWAVANFTKTWVLVLFPLIALAALIEGLISPLIIQALY